MPEEMMLETKKEEKKPGGGLFGRHEAAAPVAGTSELYSQLTNVERRLRILEERYENLRRKTQVSEQNMLGIHKETDKEIKTTTSDLLELRRDLEDLKSKARIIVKELKECAKKEDIDVVKKYLEMWEPVNFITRNEAKKIIKELIDEQKL